MAIVSGGDSGIGRAVSVAFAKEGAKVIIVYLNEHEDAEETKKYIGQFGTQCVTISGDISDEKFCNELVQNVYKQFGSIDILVNNAVEQKAQNTILLY